MALRGAARQIVDRAGPQAFTDVRVMIYEDLGTGFILRFEILLDDGSTFGYDLHFDCYGLRRTHLNSRTIQHMMIEALGQAVEDRRVREERQNLYERMRRAMDSSHDSQRGVVFDMWRRESDALEENIRRHHRRDVRRLVSGPIGSAWAEEYTVAAREPGLNLEIIDRARRRLEDNFFQAALGNFADAISGATTPEADKKALKLLRENLTPIQLSEYDKLMHFHVIGGDSGKKYRIKHGRQMNIDELDASGSRVCGWCFLPRGNVPAGDCMLAQKTALELMETEALKIANRMN